MAQALQKLMAAADATGITLYQANLRTYQLLRYGVPMQVAAGAPHETVHLIDWDTPAQNHFALAEEVPLKGGHERRPDIVLYINGIRQLISNQEAIFNQGLFQHGAAGAGGQRQPGPAPARPPAPAIAGPAA